MPQNTATVLLFPVNNTEHYKRLRRQIVNYRPVADKAGTDIRRLIRECPTTLPDIEPPTGWNSTFQRPPTLRQRRKLKQLLLKHGPR